MIQDNDWTLLVTGLTSVKHDVELDSPRLGVLDRVHCGRHWIVPGKEVLCTIQGASSRVEAIMRNTYACLLSLREVTLS